MGMLVPSVSWSALELALPMDSAPVTDNAPKEIQETVNVPVILNTMAPTAPLTVL